MTFTYDTTTDIGKVRFYTRDTVETVQKWTDEEIQFALDEETTVNAATILLLELKLIDLANPDYRADWLTESDHAEAAKTLRDLLADLRERFGIAKYTATVTHTYRADSKQTEEPDYSDGV